MFVVINEFCTTYLYFFKLISFIPHSFIHFIFLIQVTSVSKEETTSITEAKVGDSQWNVSSFHGYTVFIRLVIELPLCKSIVANLIILNQFSFVQITLNNICQASLDSQSKAIGESLAGIQEAFIAVTGMEVIEKKAPLIFFQLYLSGV